MATALYDTMETTEEYERRPIREFTEISVKRQTQLVQIREMINDDHCFPAKGLKCDICAKHIFQDLKDYIDHVESPTHSKLIDLHRMKSLAYIGALKRYSDLAEYRREKQLAETQKLLQKSLGKLKEGNNGAGKILALKKDVKERQVIMNTLVDKSPELLAYEQAIQKKYCDLCDFGCEKSPDMDRHMCSLIHIKAKYAEAEYFELTGENNNEQSETDKYREMAPIASKVIRDINERKKKVKKMPGDARVSIPEDVPDAYDGSKAVGLEKFVVTHFHCSICKQTMRTENVYSHARSYLHYQNLSDHLKEKKLKEDLEKLEKSKD